MQQNAANLVQTGYPPANAAKFGLTAEHSQFT